MAPLAAASSLLIPSLFVLSEGSAVEEHCPSTGCVPKTVSLLQTMGAVSKTEAVPTTQTCTPVPECVSVEHWMAPFGAQNVTCDWYKNAPQNYCCNGDFTSKWNTSWPMPKGTGGLTAAEACCDCNHTRATPTTTAPPSSTSVTTSTTASVGSSQAPQSSTSVTTSTTSSPSTSADHADLINKAFDDFEAKEERLMRGLREAMLNMEKAPSTSSVTGSTTAPPSTQAPSTSVTTSTTAAAGSSQAPSTSVTGSTTASAGSSQAPSTSVTGSTTASAGSSQAPSTSVTTSTTAAAGSSQAPSTSVTTSTTAAAGSSQAPSTSSVTGSTTAPPSTQANHVDLINKAFDDFELLKDELKAKLENLAKAEPEQEAEPTTETASTTSSAATTTR